MKKATQEHIFAIGILLVALIIFCLPAIQGKILNSHDYVSWQYMSHEADQTYKAKPEPIYWTNSMFGGMPTCTFYGGSSGNIFATGLLGSNNNFARPIIMFLVALLSFYTLMSALRLKWLVRIVGTIGFMLSSYNPIIAAAGHDTKFLAISLAAGVLASMLMVWQGRRYLGFSLLALYTVLMITTGHYQIVYYAIGMFVIVGIFELIAAQKRGQVAAFLRDSAIIIAIACVALLPTIKSVVLTRDYTQYTMRGGSTTVKALQEKDKPVSKGLDIEYAYRWSNGVQETFAALIPGLYGPTTKEDVYANGETMNKIAEAGINGQNASMIAQSIPGYWGPQPFLSGPVYFGAIICFLFILGLIVVNDHRKWWIVAACAVFFIMSWGKNFEAINNWLFYHLPGYSKFRTPSMALVIPQILFPLLAALGLQKIISTEDKTTLKKPLLIAGGITIGLIVLLGFGASFFQNFVGKADEGIKQQLAEAAKLPAAAINTIYTGVKADRAAYVRGDAMMSLLFVALAFVLLYVYISNKKMNHAIIVSALALLVFADLSIVAKNYVSEERYYFEKDEQEAMNFAPRRVDQQILQDKDLFYRVHDLSTDPFNDAQPAYTHHLVGGYSPAKLQVYQDMIQMHIGRNNREVLNMMNTKYIIVPGQGKGQEQVMPNPTACGNAWFVPSIKMVNTADEEILALNAPSLSDTTATGSFVAKQMAIVRNDAGKLSATSFAIDSSSKITLTSYGLQDMVYSSSNKNAGYAVFSEIYHPDGWTATIDDKPATIVKTNYILRGLEIPAGPHTIKFHFEPPSAKKYHGIAQMSSFAVLALILGMLFMAWKKGELFGSNDEEAAAAKNENA